METKRKVTDMDGYLEKIVGKIAANGWKDVKLKRKKGSGDGEYEICAAGKKIGWLDVYNCGHCYVVKVKE
jgi:hypothetical protein